ncbi:MAG: hypothetical protein ABIN80_15470 [Dyadobacter sp.]|uniref:hypothetical protein n=1 Tax=Dyadobacter sp. TaxID=1914288 RepID=UPI003262D8D2
MRTLKTVFGQNIKPNLNRDMKVECIRTSLDNPPLDSINHNLDEYLTIGDSFLVYGIRFAESGRYVYIYDGNHLIEAPISLFKIIHDLTPKWKIKIWENMEITFWPELFYESDFLENFAERESEERQLFSDLQLEIEERFD